MVVLLTSELVSNAICHAAHHTGPGLDMCRLQAAVLDQGATVRVEVWDQDPRAPVLRDDDPLAEHGRGLRLVLGQASKYGVEIDEGGKTVWFERAMTT